MRRLLVRYALLGNMGWDSMTNPSKNHIGMPNIMPWIVVNQDACCAATVEEFSKNELYKNCDKSKMWTNAQIDTATD
jgi:hypothetical protein